MSDLFETIAIIVIHTPLWVWPLYALLIFLGFQRTRDRTLPLWRELILPVVVTILAVLNIVAAGPSSLPAAVLGLAIGGAAAWRLERPDATRRLPDGSIWLRGEWWSLVQIVLVLVFRYATSIVSAMAPALNADMTWHLGTVFTSALLSALFLGRTAARLRVYFSTSRATGVDLGKDELPVA
jgi:hypothetical protein